MTLARVVNKRSFTGSGIYIGRPGPWGNPFVVGKDGERGECVKLYRVWLWEEIRAGRISKRSLAALHGKTLICWCAPRSCHGNVLASAALWAHNECKEMDS